MDRPIGIVIKVLANGLGDRGSVPVRVIPNTFGGARGVVVIAVGNEHGDTSSNPGRY